MASAKFLLSECDTTFYAVMRAELADAQTREALEEVLPGVQYIIVPPEASAFAVAHAPRIVKTTVAQMWHEVAYAAQAIDLSGFDLVMRTRFDIYFQRQSLPELSAGEDDVFLPRTMSWSGSNDMLCVHHRHRSSGTPPCMIA